MMRFVYIVASLLFGIPLALFAGLIATGLVIFMSEGLLWAWCSILRVSMPFESSTFGPSK